MQPENYPFNPLMFGPVCFPGDYVGLQMSTDRGQNVYGRVYGIYINPTNEVNFGAVTNGTASSPAQALTSSTDQLAVGLEEFVQVRFKLDTRDFAANAIGSDAQVQLFQPGAGSQQWQSANAIWAFAPSDQIDWGPYSVWTEHFYRGITTPYYKINNQSAVSMTNSRIAFKLIHYWFRPLGQGDKNLPPMTDTPTQQGVLSTPSGQIIYVPVGQFASTGTSAGTPSPSNG